MSEETDELLEAEYMEQQEVVSNIQSVEINWGKEKKPEIEVSALLIDISETLRLLSEQMVCLNEVTKTLPETVAALQTTTESVQCISSELPDMIRKQCLEEYKKILANAVKNYNQMQKAAYQWQRSIGERGDRIFWLITISAITTLILLLLNLFLK